MKRPIVPIAEITRRLPEAGRLRFGVKSGRAMKAIGTWRATSHDEEAIAQVAQLYGGTPEPWKDAPTPGQWQVITNASELRIVLPPDALGNSPQYEQWTGGGCQRRCDGIHCEVIGSGPDGPEPQEVPCLCDAKGEMVCEPRLRLNVILPEIRFGGVWRMETKSWNACQEVPGMVDLIQSLQQRGLTRGLLALKHRKSVSAGETHRFIVPVLGVDESMEALASGAAQLGALPAPEPTPQIAAGEGPTRQDEAVPPPPLTSPAASFVRDPEGDAAGMAHPSDDDVIDAEIVDDEPLDIEGVYAAASMSPTKSLKHARLIAEQKGLPLPLSVQEITGDLARYVVNDLAKVGA